MSLADLYADAERRRLGLVERYKAAPDPMPALASSTAGSMPALDLGLGYNPQLMAHTRQYEYNSGWVGACFPAGTPVSLPDGVLAIEEIEPGERVLDHLGVAREVLQAGCRLHTGILVTVQPRCAPAILATDEHPFLVLEDGKERWVRAGELDARRHDLLMPAPAHERDRLTWTVAVANENCHPNDPRANYQKIVRVDETLLRLAGLFLAEGNATWRVSGSGRSFPSGVQFSFAAHETDYLDFVDRVMCEVFECRPAIRDALEGTNCVSVRYASRVAAEFFLQFGHGASEKYIPAWVQALPRPKLLALLRGHWEGDGTYGQRRFSSATASPSLADGLRRLWLRCGMFANMYREEPRTNIINGKEAVGNGLSRVEITGRYFNEAADAFGWPRERAGRWDVPKSMVRLLSAEQEKPAYAALPLRYVQRREVVSLPVYNLEVAETHTYLAGGVAVHNCVKTIAQRIAGQEVKVARYKARAGRPGTSGNGSAAAGGVKRPHVDRLPRTLKAQADNLEVIENHPLLDAINDPNAVMVRWALLYVTVVSLELTGKAHWWFFNDRRDRTGKWSILPLPSHWVQPIHTQERLFAQWEIRPNRSAKAITVPGEEVAYVFYPDAADPLGAISPLQTQSKAVVADEAITEAQRRAFSQGLWPGVAVTMARNAGVNGQEGARPRLDSHQRAQIINMVKQAYRGVANYDEPMILDGWIEAVNRLSNSPREMDFTKSGEYTKSRITQGFGVNPIVMGQVEGANRASSATADDHFCNSTVNPKIELISQCLTAWVAPLFAAPGERLYVWIEPAQAIDPDLQMQRLKLLMSYGAITINDLRAEFGWPQVPGGNVAMLPATLVPLDLSKKQSQADQSGGQNDKPPEEGKPPASESDNPESGVDTGDRGEDKTDPRAA